MATRTRQRPGIRLALWISFGAGLLGALLCFVSLLLLGRADHKALLQVAGFRFPAIVVWPLLAFLGSFVGVLSWTLLILSADPDLE